MNHNQLLAHYEDALDRFVGLTRKKVAEHGRDMEIAMLTTVFMDTEEVPRDKIVGLLITALLRLADAEEIAGLFEQQP